MRYNAVISYSFGTDPLKEDETGYDEPVTVDEVKDWGKISNSTDDAIIDRLIKVARLKLEKFTGAAMKPKTVTAVMRNQLGLGELPYGPHSTEGITWKADNEDQTDDLLVSYDTPFLTVTDETNSLLAITYTSGYGLEGGVELPEDLRQAIITEAVYLYFNRGEVNKNGVRSDIAKSLAEPYKRSWI